MSLRHRPSRLKTSHSAGQLNSTFRLPLTEGQGRLCDFPRFFAYTWEVCHCDEPSAVHDVAPAGPDGVASSVDGAATRHASAYDDVNWQQSVNEDYAPSS